MVYIYIFTMAAVTYLIRMIPLTIFRKKITNTFVKSFLYYVPYAVLSAMTFPAIFSSTGTKMSGIAGCEMQPGLIIREVLKSGIENENNDSYQDFINYEID